MKLLSVEQARAIWLFPLRDTNPTGKYVYSLFADLVTRYKFATVPNVVEATKANQGIVYSQGEFIHNERGALDVGLGVYHDGLIADTTSDTNASEAFLDDVLRWLQKDLGLVYPTHIRKQYLSRIFVETNKSLNTLNSKLETIGKLISEKSAPLGPLSYQLGGINFMAEQVGPAVPAVFRFERREKTPYSDNAYYSFAPLSTDDHLHLLEQFEAILS